MTVCFTLPAEWHPQRAILLVWPHNRSDWNKSLGPIEQVYEDLAWEISRRQQLWVVCYDETLRDAVARRLAQRGCPRESIRFYIAATNDTWARDTAPLTVLDGNGQGQLCNFQFNGWGGKYAHDLDNQLNDRLAEQGAFGKSTLNTVDLVLEGGSVETDGAGTLLSTTHCLLTPTRNPSLTKNEIEHSLRNHLGIDRVLWLSQGYLAGDDTDSHIDNLARFASYNTIVYVKCDDRKDEHYTALSAMESQLQAFRQRNGTPYNLVPLPWPQPQHDDSERLPASYANFLILNEAVLVPSFDDPSDNLACERIATCFPGREIVPVDSRPLIAQRGGIHCATMQFPLLQSLP